MEKNGKVKEESFEVVTYQTKNGTDVMLNFEVIKKYLVRGKSEFVNPQEMVFFMGICREKGLNPFAQDCYLVKYAQDDPAAIITSIEFLRARARAQKDCQGWEAGIIVRRDDEIIKTHGLILEEDELLGGWFRGQPKGWLKPLEWEVPLKSFVRMKKDGTLTAFWRKEKQPFMIAKVAEAQGLKKLWPGDLSHLYEEAEIGPGLTGYPEVEEEKVRVDVISETEKDFWSRVKQTSNLMKEKVQEYLETYSNTMGIPMIRLLSEALESWDDFVGDFQNWCETTEQTKKRRGRPKGAKKVQPPMESKPDEKNSSPGASSEAESEPEVPKEPKSTEKAHNDYPRPIGEYPFLFTVIPHQVIDTSLDDVKKLLPRMLTADQANRILFLIKKKPIERDEFIGKVAEICKKK